MARLGAWTPPSLCPHATTLNSENPLQAVQNGLIPELREPAPRRCKSTLLPAGSLDARPLSHCDTAR
jgi:hypothetical protein